MMKTIFHNGHLWRAACAFMTVVLMFTALNPAHAESYPERTVRIIVPYGAGGIADVTMRLVAQKLTGRFGQQFIIDNRPGAGGAVGVKAAASAAPDGYTLSMIGGGLTISAALFKSLPYDLVNDFIPVSTTAFYSLVIAAKAGSPLKTVQDVIAASRANPGKLNFGTINPGSNQHLSAELFRAMSGIKVTMIPYKTTPELVTALVRGDIDVAFEYQAALQGSLDDRQIIAIATTGRERASVLPNVPTVEESGIPDYEVTSWNGLAAPAGTPANIVNLLNNRMNFALSLPDIKSAMAKFGMEARGSTVDDLRARIRRDIDKWTKVIETAGIEKK
jgi:tripartite-type tricarboxylate transporter receptor subunit TctC